MSEEQIEPTGQEVEELPPKEDAEPAGQEVEEMAPEEQPADKRPVWLTVIIIIAAVALLCCLLTVCTVTAITLFSDSDEVTPTPVQPGKAYMSISEPVQGATVRAIGVISRTSSAISSVGSAAAKRARRRKTPISRTSSRH